MEILCKLLKPKYVQSSYSRSYESIVNLKCYIIISFLLKEDVVEQIRHSRGKKCPEGCKGLSPKQFQWEHNF